MPRQRKARRTSAGAFALTLILDSDVLSRASTGNFNDGLLELVLQSGGAEVKDQAARQ
jgi:hypothetical protein